MNRIVIIEGTVQDYSHSLVLYLFYGICFARTNLLIEKSNSRFSNSIPKEKLVRIRFERFRILVEFSREEEERWPGLVDVSSFRKVEAP